MFAYTEEGGTTAVCSKQSSIPDGATWVETASVPPSVFRSSWVILGEGIDVNLSMAKLEAHKARRDKRETAFGPHDEVIMKKIPTADAAVAEAARAAIRTTDAALQITIDACVDSDTLLELYTTEVI